MISSIDISAFKAFQQKTVGLSQLTVLTGLNNSGKSSLMQAIRMAVSPADAYPKIDGLGGYKDVRSRFSAPNAPIQITAHFRDQDAITALSISNDRVSRQGGAKLPFVQFVSADRYGPRVKLPIIENIEANIKDLTVGLYGEYSAQYASCLEDLILEGSLRHPEAKGFTLKHQLGWWLSDVAPGLTISFDVDDKTDSSRLSVDTYRATNSGYGISYTMPVILALLTMSASVHSDKGQEPDDSRDIARRWTSMVRAQGGLLLIENPEAHLHPRGQTAIGRLIARSAASGVQIIVETHSDYVIDGIRLAVKDFPQEADNVSIKYFDKKINGETQITEIAVHPDGRLDQWPAGFFDQSLNNLRNLAAKKS